jgi:hypothetical protein
MSNLLNAALSLAQQGLPVFPCADDKRPAWSKAEGGNGFHDASDNSEAVERLFGHRRASLIGVPTGIPSGFDVLDIDPRHGGHNWWFANKHRMPDTWMHRTRGGGLHALFRHVDPVRNSESKIAPGVDTRGQGGYLIWWPAHGCTVTEAAVMPWPEWLLNKLLHKAETTTRKAGKAFGPLDSSDRAQRIAERVLGRLEHAGQGQLHYTLRKASYTLGGLLDLLPFGKDEAGQRLYEAAKRAGAVDLENASRTIDWGLKCGQAAPLGRENSNAR